MDHSFKQFLLRDFQPEDYLSIIQLWDETGLGGEVRGDSLETIRQSLDLGGRLLVLAEKAGGRIAGTSWMTFDGRRIHLHHFGIKPEFQGMGLGKWLTAESLNIAGEIGVQVKLEVHRNNEEAIRLYRSFGFTPLGEYDVYILREPDDLPDSTN